MATESHPDDSAKMAIGGGAAAAVCLYDILRFSIALKRAMRDGLLLLDELSALPQLGPRSYHP